MLDFPFLLSGKGFAVNVCNSDVKDDHLILGLASYDVGNGTWPVVVP